MAINKKFFYKVFDYTGNIITTWSSEVINEPSFKMIINSGQGELKIQLGRPIGNYGEDVDVKFLNRVKLYISDLENPNGLLIYSGYIADYQPVVEGTGEYIEITTLGYVTELENTNFIDMSGNTAKVYTTYEPANIIKDILTLYASYHPYPMVTAGSIDNVGVTRDYTLNNISNQQAIDKVREMCPSGWYWYVDENNQLNFHLKSPTADHTFIIGKHLTKIDAFKTIRDLKNAVRFIGGVPSGSAQLYKYYTDPTSIGIYGTREYVMIDQRVSIVETADAMAQAYLDANKAPFVRATVTILDSNGDDQSLGYDIESIKPGQTCKIIDPNFNAGVQSYALNQVMIIQTVQYNYDTVELELSIRPPWVAKRIQDIYRDLNKNIVANTPTAPNGTGVPIAANNFGNATYGDPSQPAVFTSLWGTSTDGLQINSAGIIAKKASATTFQITTAGDVTIVGTITATAGAIGGWSISAAAIYFDGAADANSAGMAPADWPFYAGKKYAGRATAPFRVNPAGVVYATGAVIDGTSTLGGRLGSTIASAINSVGELITANLNTSAKTILGDFTFGASGAIKMITDANNGLWISPTGILGKKAGVNTFAIGIDGTANFSGTLSSASGTFGTITGGTLVGLTTNCIGASWSSPAVKFYANSTDYNNALVAGTVYAVVFGAKRYLAIDGLDGISLGVIGGNLTIGAAITTMAPNPTDTVSIGGILTVGTNAGKLQIPVGTNLY